MRIGRHTVGVRPLAATGEANSCAALRDSPGKINSSSEFSRISFDTGARNLRTIDIDQFVDLARIARDDLLAGRFVADALSVLGRHDGDFDVTGK